MYSLMELNLLLFPVLFGLHFMLLDIFIVSR